MPDKSCTQNFIYDGCSHPAFVVVWFNEHQEESRQAAINANLLAYSGASDVLSPNSIVEGLVEIHDVVQFNHRLVVKAHALQRSSWSAEHLPSNDRAADLCIAAMEADIEKVAGLIRLIRLVKSEIPEIPEMPHPR